MTSWEMETLMLKSDSDTNSLPPLVPGNTDKLNRALTLLGNRGNHELKKRARRELVELVGAYPDGATAMLWKTELKKLKERAIPLDDGARRTRRRTEDIEEKPPRRGEVVAEQIEPESRFSTVDVETLRRKTTACLSAVQRKVAVVTRAGQPIAILVGIQGYDLEDVHYMTNPTFRALIEDARWHPGRPLEDALGNLSDGDAEAR